MNSKYKNTIQEIINRAKFNKIQFGYTLLRVSGAQCEPDSMRDLMDLLDKKTATATQIEENKELWQLLINLNRGSKNETYSRALKASNNESYLKNALPYLPEELVAEINMNKTDNFLTEFATYILNLYSKEFEEFFSKPQFIRTIDFVVMEFDKDFEGAYFIAHHSNGTCSRFKRTATDTTAENLQIELDGIVLLAWSTNPLKKEWLFNGEPFYKCKLPGKYNHDGEWKPIVYQGNSNIPMEAAKKISADKDIQGQFFYLYTTYYPVVEFTLKTKISLPEIRTKFDNGIHLFRVPETNESEEFSNEHIYDGWIRYEDLTEDGISAAIDTIRLTIETLSFAFESETHWQLKYPLESHYKGVATPDQEDLESSYKLISAVTNSQDCIMPAIHWFNLGVKSKSPINAFICHFIAIEGIAVQLKKNKSDKEIVREFDELLYCPHLRNPLN